MVIQEKNKNILKNSVAGEQLVEQCDEWLAKYRKSYDILDRICSSKKGNRYSLHLELAMNEAFDIQTAEEKYEFALNLKYPSGRIFLEGPSLVVDPRNEAVIEYLLASVVTDYVERNCHSAIDLSDFSGKLDTLKPQYTATYPQAVTSCDMSTLFETKTNKFTPTIFRVLAFHNHGEDSLEYMEEYRQEAMITPGVEDKAFKNSVEHTNQSYEYVLRFGGKERQ